MNCSTYILKHFDSYYCNSITHPPINLLLYYQNNSALELIRIISSEQTILILCDLKFAMWSSNKHSTFCYFTKLVGYATKRVGCTKTVSLLRDKCAVRNVVKVLSTLDYSHHVSSELVTLEVFSVASRLMGYYVSCSRRRMCMVSMTNSSITLISIVPKQVVHSNSKINNTENYCKALGILSKILIPIH